MIAAAAALALAAPGPGDGQLWVETAVAVKVWESRSIDVPCDQVVPRFETRVDEEPGQLLGFVSGPCGFALTPRYARESRVQNDLRVSAHECSTVVHEVGHLAGLTHEDPRFAIMRPETDTIVRECWRWAKQDLRQRKDTAR
jgi:hypothetical protein